MLLDFLPQKNELLLLIEQLDHKTFECQVGDIRGRVQKSHMKVITPLSNAPTKPALSQVMSSTIYNELSIKTCLPSYFPGNLATP